MATITNIALNSRSLNGCILISDGNGTIIENGNITTGDINSASLNTDNINTNLLNVTGKLECNSAGPYNIPTSISSVTGLLIGYGNVSNSGATDFTNFGSTYTSTQGGFRFWNKSATQTLTNLGIIDNTQTYFKSQLVGCLAETPLNPTSVVNKTYVDDNFVDRTNNLTQSINGLKTFTNNVEIFNATNPSLILATSASANTRSIIKQTATNLSINNQAPASSIIFQINGSTCATINNSQLLLPASIFLTTNDMKSRAPTGAHTLLADISTGTLTISSSTASNTLNGATQTNQQITFNNFTPISNVATPTANNHLVRKDYVDNNFVNLSTAQNIYGSKYFGSRVQLYGGIALDVGPGTSTFAGVVTFSNNLTCSASLISNNITAPIASGTNSIYSNTTTGIISIGSNLTTTGSIDLGNTTSTTKIYGALTFYNSLNPPFKFTNIQQLSSNLNIENTTFSGSIYLKTRPSFGASVDSVIITATETTVSNLLVSNNITAPASTIAGINNIFTNLSSGGYGVINIGAQGDDGPPSTMNQINVKSKLNIVESVYGTTPTKITTIQQEGNSCRFTNDGSTNGNFIFSIVESGTFVPLVINKTSLEIKGNLILYDTTPTSTNMIIGVLGNDMTFDPNDSFGTTYNFKTNDSIGVTTTPLTISTALTTINTPTTITELLTCKNLELSFTGNASINCPNATGLNLFLSLTTQTIGLFSNLTSAIVNFCSSSVFTTIFNINSRIKHKQFQYINEVKSVSSTSVTLSLPLEQTIMLTSAGATGVNITLPALTLSTQAGFTFNVIKTGSITNTITFTASGSNLIRTYGSITGASTASALGGIETIINIFTLEVSAGNFVWQIY